MYRLLVITTALFTLMMQGAADDRPQKVRSMAVLADRFKKSVQNMSPSRSPREKKQASPHDSSPAHDSPRSLPLRSRSDAIVTRPFYGPSAVSRDESPRSPLTKEQKILSADVEETLNKLNLWKDLYQRIGNRKRTIVMHTARVGQADQVDGLLDYDNSGIDLCDAEGKTALTIAAEEGKAEVVAVLFKHRSHSLYQKDYSGSTPLMYAARRNDPHVVRQLLTEDAQGECINMVSNKGKSALIDAVERGAVESVRVLLEYRPDVTLVDCEGLDALGHACQKHDTSENKESYERIITMLKEYMYVHDKEGPTLIDPSLFN